MDLALKQRLVGATVLIALAVIFLPMLLDGSGTPERLDVEVEIPPRADAPQSRLKEPDVAGELAGEDTGAADSATRTAEPAVTGWVVQVAAFSKEANAMVLRDRLRNQGHAAFVEPGEADGNRIWRVRIGPVPKESEARTIASELEAERGQATLVVRYP